MTTDRELMRRLTIVLAFVFLFTAAFAHLQDVYAKKFFEVTGKARWIWAQHRMSNELPLAFFAARDVDLPERRLYTHLKLLGDPEYTLFVNGRQLAGRRVGEERQIDFYDLSPHVKTGRNRIVVAVRASQGIGGLIGSIDIGPEAESWVVTDSTWKIYRAWRPELLVRDLPDVKWERPAIVGEPPVGRWNFLAAAPSTPEVRAETPFAPKEAFELKAQLPKIRTRSGVAVAVAEESRARAFDFGFTKGRVRITLDANRHFASRAVTFRTANLREELDAIVWTTRSVVFAPGETVVTTPEEHAFRYILVFGTNARAEVVQ